MEHMERMDQDDRKKTVAAARGELDLGRIGIRNWRCLVGGRSGGRWKPSYTLGHSCSAAISPRGSPI